MKEEQASSTAFSVLQGILLTASRPGYAGAVPPDMEEACKKVLEASAEGRRRLGQLRNPIYRMAAPVLERLVLPGFTLHYVFRKRFIEDTCLLSLADGYTQVVSLGAGFDTMAWRLHRRYPNVSFIEIDHPATSRVKTSALSDVEANLHFLAVDLAVQDLEGVLRESPVFDASRPTLYVCEGVLMYLPLPAVEGIFQTLKRISGKGARLVFSAVAPTGTPGNNTGPLLRLYLAFKGEPLSWNLLQEDLDAFVRSQGYRLTDQANDVDLAPRYLSRVATGLLHRGEFLAVADAE